VSILTWKFFRGEFDKNENLQNAKGNEGSVVRAETLPYIPREKTVAPKRSGTKKKQKTSREKTVLVYDCLVRGTRVGGNGPPIQPEEGRGNWS